MEWQPTPVVFPGEFYGQRSLVNCSSWGYRESDVAEWLALLSLKSLFKCIWSHTPHLHPLVLLLIISYWLQLTEIIYIYIYKTYIFLYLSVENKRHESSTLIHFTLTSPNIFMPVSAWRWLLNKWMNEWSLGTTPVPVEQYGQNHNQVGIIGEKLTCSDCSLIIGDENHT